jgi:hypothetical protein
LYFMNTVTVGAKEILSPQGPPSKVPTVPRLKNMNGYSTATTWLVLNRGGTQYGGTRESMREAPSQSMNGDRKMQCRRSVRYGQEIADYYTWTVTRMPTHCRPISLMRVLDRMLTELKDMIAKYAPEYDRFYSAYSAVYRQNANDAFRRIIFGKGNQCFRCNINGMETQCPSTPIDESGLAHDIQSITYILVDAEGFYNRIQGKYRLKREWINFVDESVPVNRKMPGKQAGTTINAPDTFKIHQKPQLHMKAIQVPNPKIDGTSLISNISMNLNDAKWAVENFAMNASNAQVAWSCEPQVRQLGEVARAVREVAMEGQEAKIQLE